MTNKDRTIFKLYKRAYDSKVDELTDIFAEEDKNAAENAGSLSTRTLVSGGAGLLGGLLLTKLLDADNSAGFGRYALMGALGAGLGAGAGYYFNKPAVTSAEERDKMLDEAATQDEETAKIDAKEGAKARNHLLGQSGASIWTIADLRRRLRRHRGNLEDTLRIDQDIKAHPTGGKLFSIDPSDDVMPRHPGPTAKKKKINKYNEAHKAWQELQHKKTLNAELEGLMERQRELRRLGYVVGDGGIAKATGVRQLKGIGKALGLGVARHGAFALATALLNKAL